MMKKWRYTIAAGILPLALLVGCGDLGEIEGILHEKLCISVLCLSKRQDIGWKKCIVRGEDPLLRKQESDVSASGPVGGHSGQ